MVIIEIYLLIIAIYLLVSVVTKGVEIIINKRNHKVFHKPNKILSYLWLYIIIIFHPLIAMGSELDSSVFMMISWLAAIYEIYKSSKSTKLTIRYISFDKIKEVLLNTLDNHYLYYKVEFDEENENFVVINLTQNKGVIELMQLNGWHGFELDKYSLTFKNMNKISCFNDILDTLKHSINKEKKELSSDEIPYIIFSKTIFLLGILVAVIGLIWFIVFMINNISLISV